MESTTCTCNYQCSLCGWLSTDLSELLVHPYTVATGMQLPLQDKCLFWLLKAFYFQIFPMFSSTCKTPAIFIWFNIGIHLVTEDSTSTSVPDDV